MKSLKTRLALALSGGLLLLLGLQYWAVSTTIRSTAEGYVASRLRHDAENLVAGLEWEAKGPAVEAADPLYRRPYSGHYYRIRTDSRTLRSRSLWDGELPKAEVEVGRSRRLHAQGPQAQPLLTWVAAFRKKGHEVQVAVAEDLSSLNADLRVLQWRYALISLAIAAAILGLQWTLVGLSLRPLDRLRREVKALEHGDCEGLSEDVPTEVKPLVQELNRLLDVLSERLERSRNALGNLAHALKTPLSRLFQVVERPPANSDNQREILEPAREIQRRIDRELKRARLAAGPAGKRFDPGRDIPALIRALDRIYAGKELSIRYDGPDPGHPFGDREDLLELTGNLLDNACRWAESEVWVRVLEGRCWTLIVEDDGPGVPPEKREALTRRGSRLDETQAGHGLGLAIVGDIAEAYGGSLRLEASAGLGGLAVRVALPPSPSL